MEQIITVGLDLAKHVFQLHGEIATERSLCGSSVRYRSLRQLGPEGPVKAFVPSMLAFCHQQEA